MTTAAAPVAKVAYVAYAFPVLTQTFTVREVEALRGCGLDVRVFAARSDPDSVLDTQARDEAARARYLPGAASAGALAALLAWIVRRPLRSLATLFTCLGGRYRDRPFAHRARAPLHFALGTALARELRREGGYTRVHAQMVDAGSTVAFVAARLLDIPFSLANHTAYNPFLLPAKARCADVVVSISEFDRDLVVRDCGSWVAPKVVVSRVGIRLGEWESLPRRPEPGRVLVVGALREKKGHAALIEAAAILARRAVPVRLRFAGSGPEEGRLRGLASARGVAVEFLGATSPDDVRTEMTSAAVLSLPCLLARNGDIDGIPVAIMEAMAAAVPVVSTRISGIPELVEDGRSGLLAEPGDAESLAVCLERVLTDPGLALSLAREARLRVASLHDLDRTSAALAALLRGRAA